MHGSSNNKRYTNQSHCCVSQAVHQELDSPQMPEKEEKTRQNNGHRSSFVSFFLATLLTVGTKILGLFG